MTVRCWARPAENSGMRRFSQWVILSLPFLLHTPTLSSRQGDFFRPGKKCLTPLLPKGYKTTRICTKKHKEPTFGDPCGPDRFHLCFGVSGGRGAVCPGATSDRLPHCAPQLRSRPG